jgi:hypothetical protein
MIEVSPGHIVRCHLFAKLENKKQERSDWCEEESAIY